MTPLHVIGDYLRQLFAAVPLPAVRVLFVAVPLVMLVWVLTLPRSAVVPPESKGRWDENLKVWAGLALLIQVVIYCVM